ncbi:MAG TPA: molecular chaperone HtpG, partial [Polyangiaceae bacterium]|nr:molecular chaperone HtpG [Polyangiaceae bacterium]
MTTEEKSKQGDPSGAVELPFQAEVQQVLGLVINSLYTHKEVFLRELVSNASDALDKARFVAMTRKEVSEQVGEPRISIKLDDDARTITLEDNGIGMTRDEVIQNLGTIARSGSLEFMKAYADAAKNKEAGLRIIGQFGVGFYAAFMVASRVDVKTRSMLPGAEPVIWRSTGSGSFTVMPGERETPGTEIVLHLKEEEREYLKVWRVKDIIKKYSDFVQFPIYLNDELANRSSAIWALPKSQVTEEQHTEFFRRITGFDAQTPLVRVHMSVDAPVQFHALLYVPEKAPPDLFGKERRGLRLYAKRILILEDCEKLVPAYLRFLRGVVDSEDLPLNVSREILQEDKNLAKIQEQLTKSTLRALKELAESDAERYLTFWREFGRLIKEGLAMDWKHKDELAGLCRFESHKTEAGKLISLRQYVDAMPEGQSEIHFLTGPNRRAVEAGPHLEGFKKRGYDVLLLSDPVDEWVVQTLHEFDKRKLKSAAHGEVDLGDDADKKAEDEVASAVAVVKTALGARVKDVRFSRRLTDSASCLVADEGDPGANMERIMKMLDAKSAEETPRILELNPSHPIIKNLSLLSTQDPNSPKLAAWSELLFDQALLAEGIVKEPIELVKRIQSLLTEASGAAVGG